MMKKSVQVFSMLLFFIGVLSLTFTVKADQHTQILTIVKYGLSKGATGFAPDQTIDTGEEINNMPVYDNTGKELKALANISYGIQKVVATGAQTVNLSNSATYQKEGDVQTITTNSQGTASLVLTDGYYIVSEESNAAAGLMKPEAPVLLSLPSWDTQSNSYLSTIYLYPKSSVDEEKTSPTPPSKPRPITPIPKNKEKPKAKNPYQKILGKLPKTGTAQSISLVIGGAILLFLAIFIKRRQKDKEEQQSL
ncbi:pilin N-terminal domain-containing protein [Lactococcus nasutitermitis]|uniref:Pilin N-terminal domain-containing protein n=1 Tax=Lactococcus nasutitermitis TaxID=1652957 RepID=A0ABV9JE70_9LACT|nr:pilin N-terminal domain-containing protein [Lactococcus nasutitermitis]